VLPSVICQQLLVKGCADEQHSRNNNTAGESYIEMLPSPFIYIIDIILLMFVLI
jgi:hypothetical protein